MTTELSAMKQTILDYLQFKAHADNTIRGEVIPLVIAHIGKGEDFVIRCIDELVEDEYLSRSEDPTVYEILTGNKWKLSFGSVRTFKRRDEGRDYIQMYWGEYDAFNKKHRPNIVRNMEWQGPKKEISLVPLGFKVTKKPHLQGTDSLTVALNALIEIATLPENSHANYHKHLAVDVLETVISECKCLIGECKREECTQTCWAEREIALLTLPRALKSA